jgi:hypothetical protein
MGIYARDFFGLSNEWRQRIRCPVFVYICQRRYISLEWIALYILRPPGCLTCYVPNTFSPAKTQWLADNCGRSSYTAWTYLPDPSDTTSKSFPFAFVMTELS